MLLIPVPVEANLHTQWDLYGSFCFVPAEKDANAMLEALKTCNQQWQELFDDFEPSGLTPTRPLNV